MREIQILLILIMTLILIIYLALCQEIKAYLLKSLTLKNCDIIVYIYRLGTRGAQIMLSFKIRQPVCANLESKMKEMGLLV